MDTMDTKLNHRPKLFCRQAQPRAAVPAPRLNCSRANSDQYRLDPYGSTWLGTSDRNGAAVHLSNSAPNLLQRTRNIQSGSANVKLQKTHYVSPYSISVVL